MILLRHWFYNKPQHLLAYSHKTHINKNAHTNCCNNCTINNMLDYRLGAVRQRGGYTVIQFMRLCFHFKSARRQHLNCVCTDIYYYTVISYVSSVCEWIVFKIMCLIYISKTISKHRTFIGLKGSRENYAETLCVIDASTYSAN